MIYIKLEQLHQEPGLVVISLCIWYYVLIIFIIYELINIYKTDVRDPLLINSQRQQQYLPQDLIFCVMCNRLVLKSSYHCWKCSKCVNMIDHHCKYLNCCIADDNYIPFLRMLIIFIIYSCVYVVLILVEIGSMFITVVQCIMTICLFVFHVYLNCIAKERTYEFVQRIQGGHKKQRYEYNKPPVELIQQSYFHS